MTIAASACLRARRSRQALRSGRTAGFVICGTHSGRSSLDIIPFRSQKQVIGSFTTTGWKSDCLDLAKDGKITPLVHAKFPLMGGEREAMAMMERRERSERSSSGLKGAR